MIDTIVAKVKGLLLSPVETFQQSRADEPNAVFTFFAALLLVHSFILAIISLVGIESMPRFAGMPAGIALPVMVFFMALAAGFVLTLLFAAWLHLWVYLLGGRKGIMQTFKAIIYAHTPRLLLGWIPFVGFIFMLWSLVLGVLGVRELQEISTGKAILAIVIAVLIPVIIIIVLAAYFMIAYTTMSGGLVPPANMYN